MRPYLKKIFRNDGFEVSVFGWQIRNRHDSLHQRHGNAFMLVTPGDNELWCADPAMSQVILSRRKDFVQSPMVSKIVSFQGGNILVVSTTQPWLLCLRFTRRTSPSPGGGNILIY